MIQIAVLCHVLWAGKVVVSTLTNHTNGRETGGMVTDTYIPQRMSVVVKEGCTLTPA